MASTTKRRGKAGTNKPTYTVGFGGNNRRTSPGSKAFWRNRTAKRAEKSMDGIARSYDQLIRSLENATPEILEFMLRPVFHRALYYVPKKSGALEASGQLSSRKTITGASAEITFGGQGVHYAAIVHEFTHLSHQSPGRSKYLQAAMEEQLNQLLERATEAYVALLG